MIKPSSKTADMGNHHDLPDWLKTALLAPVNLFQLYRLFLAIFILLTFFTESGPLWLGYFYPGIFTAASIIYLGFVITSLITTKLKALRPDSNIQIMLFTDIFFITLLMHASGGIQTGLGILLAISVTAGSLLMRGKMALLFASFATVAVITEQFAAYLNPQHFSADFIQSAMLGLAFFAIALLSHSLSLHIQASEQLARQTKQDLNSMAQLSEHVIGHMTEGVIAIDNNRKIKLINNAAWQLLNKNELLDHMSIDDICPELGEKISALELTGNNRSAINITLSNTSEDLPSHNIKVTLTPLGSEKKEGTLIFLEDLSEITHQAQQLKLASIGRLTASIAHEIRNPLGAISHAGQLLSESEAISPNDQRLTEIITNNSERMNQIIENVLKLSRRDSAIPKSISIKPWLSDIRTKILQFSKLLPEQVLLEVIPDDLEAYFDPDQIDQVLTILANNAISHFDSEPDALRIKLKFTRSDGITSLECIDNGPGIASEDAKLIFEPFFTTRNTGTGLGLYIASELVESNKAQITYTQVSPKGSSFKIFFSKKNKQDTNT